MTGRGRVFVSWKESERIPMQPKDRRYDAVIFDLDGTLLDTLSDLTNSANAVARKYGFQTRTREEICSFVGNGIRRLITQLLPGGEENPEFDNVYRDFCAHYNAHCMDETEPYPGILFLLDRLLKDGVEAAIVSNKADFAVKKLRDIYFPELVRVAIGEREGVRRKPAPDSVFEALKELDIPVSRAVYVGDSDVDILTAQNAGMDCISVSWGFRTRSFLTEHGAGEDKIASNVNELMKLLASDGAGSKTDTGGKDGR